MKRIATPLVFVSALSASACLIPVAPAADADISTRVNKLEARIARLEALANGEDAELKDQAMRNATYSGAPADSEEVPAPPKMEGTQGSRGTYVIQTGDTLGDIARKHGVPRAALLEANRLSEGQPIYIGETLMIPAVAGTGKTETAEADSTPAPKTGPSSEEKKKEKTEPKPSAPPSADAGTHVVVTGDTLTSIAKKHGTTVAALKSANGLGSDVISTGQKLKLPGKAGQKTPVASSDSKSSGGKKYDNPLLKEGETYGYYEVQKGDNLYALARDFFTTMSELQRLNELGDSTLIYPGKELIVPTGKYNAYHNKEDEERVASR